MGAVVRVRVGVCLLLACFLPPPSSQQDDDLHDYLVDELPGEQETAVFRPLSAREAMRQAARVAYKERSLEANYAILRQAGVPGAQRVEVYDAHDVTTSRYNYKRFRKSRSWDNPRPEAADRLVQPSELDQQEMLKQQQQVKLMQQRIQQQQQQRRRQQPAKTEARQQPSWTKGRPRQSRRNHRSSREKDNFKKLRNEENNRYKRAVESPEFASKFELPPMPNEWSNRKKKKKKKKLISTDPPTTKKMKVSKRKRIFMDSAELALGGVELKKATGSRTNVVRGISKELDKLLKEADEPEVYDAHFEIVQRTTLRSKFVPIPKIWQNLPSLKPKIGDPPYGRQVRRQYMANIVTIGPQFISQESPEVKDQAVDSEQTTSSNDWRDFKSQLGGGGPSRGAQEAIKAAGLVLKPPPTGWPEPTHPPDGVYDWHRSQIKRFPRTRRPYAVHTLLSHSDHNHQFSKIQWTQWPTISYTPWSRFRVTLGPNAPARQNQNQEVQKQFSEERRLKSYGVMGKSVDHPPLTPGPPLETLDKNAVHIDSEKEGDVVAGGPGHEESHHQYQYNYGPSHAAWQSSWQGRRRTEGGGEVHQQAHHNYYANYTNYYNYYYQNYYSQLENKTRAYHYEQSHHYQDKKQVSGHYQSHYRSQFQGNTNNRLRPPGYFYNPLVDDYAGNPTEPSDYYQQTTSWPYARYNRPHQGPARRRFRGRQQRGPSVYRTIFNAPLERRTTPRIL